MAKTEFFDTTDLKDDKIYLSLVGAYEADIKRKWVPYYSFNIHLLDGTKIGYCNFRIDNTKLTKYCGNIGYCIDEKYRGNHYSLNSAKLLLKLAKKHKLKYVVISCEPGNIASNRICQLLHACYMETVDIPKFNEIYKEGKTKINIYKIILQFLTKFIFLCLCIRFSCSKNYIPTVFSQGRHSLSLSLVKNRHRTHRLAPKA